MPPSEECGPEPKSGGTPRRWEPRGSGPVLREGGAPLKHCPRKEKSIPSPAVEKTAIRKQHQTFDRYEWPPTDATPPGSEALATDFAPIWKITASHLSPCGEGSEFRGDPETIGNPLHLTRPDFNPNRFHFITQCRALGRAPLQPFPSPRTSISSGGPVRGLRYLFAVSIIANERKSLLRPRLLVSSPRRV